MKLPLLLLAFLPFLSTSGALNAQGRLIFSTRSPTAIGQHDVATGATDILVSSNLTEVLGVAVDTLNRKIFWTNNPATGPAVIEFSDYNGANRTALNIPGLISLTDITIDFISKKLVWVDNGAQKVMRANLDGSNVETLRTGTKPFGAIVNCTYNKIYWTEQHFNPGGGKIMRMELDGSQQEEVAKYDGKPVKIAIDCIENKILWTDDTYKSLYISDPGGLNVQTLLVLTGNQRPYGIAMNQDAGIVYWTDYANDQVKSLQIASAVVSDVLTETNPRALTRYFFKPVSADEPAGNPLGLQISPNPASRSMTITLNPSTRNATGIITGADGRVWKTLALEAGRNEIYTGDLPAGMYVLQVRQDHFVSTGRFVKT